MIKPQRGDIWKNKSRNMHYLVLEEPNSIRVFDYKLFVMEDGIIDYAGLNHFYIFCKKVG